VDLVSFDAKPGRNRADFTWETGAEIDNAGFYVLAQNARSKEYTRVNDTLIPGRGTETSGAFYTFSDPDARNGRKIKYALEDIEFDGDNTIHHGLAKTVVINPDVTPINLSGPAYEATVSRRGGARLQWSGPARGQVVEISSDPEFPDAATLKIRVGSTTARSLTRKDLEAAQEMSALNGEDGVYWRVKGKDGLGNPLDSQTFFFFVTD
jgi:hypothetical protein